MMRRRDYWLALLVLVLFALEDWIGRAFASCWGGF